MVGGNRRTERGRVSVMDSDPDRRKVIQNTLEGDADLGLCGAGDVPDAVLVIEPRSLDDFRTALDALPKARGPVLVGLLSEASPQSKDFRTAGADELIWLPVRADDICARIKSAIKKAQLALDAQSLRETLSSKGPGGLIGRSQPMRNVFELITRVSKNNANVLVLGETGTGKELVARAIHDESPWAGEPFVAINLSAVPADLLEAELFGHAAGAFTGARAARPGKLESAGSGTVFLDEIGDLPLTAQVKLLRVIQERVYERVGENSLRKAEFRLVCATHRDLPAMVEDGTFREDLYYRINVVQIDLPPLRLRGDDVLLLARYFLAECATRFGVNVTLSEEGERALSSHSWPGNVRELQHTVERALAVAAPGDVLGADHFKPRRRRGNASAMANEILRSEDGIDGALSRLEKLVLEIALTKTGGNHSEAARMLKLPRQTLQSRLKKHGLS